VTEPDPEVSDVQPPPIVERDEPPQMVLSGEIDVAVAGAMRTACTRIVERLDAGAIFEIDMAAVSFIDSSGLGALVAIRSASTVAGVTLRLVDVPEGVLRLLELTGLHDSFDTTPVKQPPS